jgi:hypothetical protein
MFTRSAQLFAIALLLASAIGARAFAGDDTSGQRPPNDAQQDGQQPTNERTCIVHNEDFTASKTFVIELTNTCEQRIRCTLHAYIVNASGPTKGEATLTLEPASKGADARKVYTVKLKESYGEANTSQSCETL